MPYVPILPPITFLARILLIPYMELLFPPPSTHCSKPVLVPRVPYLTHNMAHLVIACWVFCNILDTDMEMSAK